jgi:hypothetical protein
MDYATTQRTIYDLRCIQQLLAAPDSWRQGDDHDDTALGLGETFHKIGAVQDFHRRHGNGDGVYPGDLERGLIPEPVWFVRQAMNQIAPEFGGLIFEWNDAAGRTHEEVLSLVASALELARAELAELMVSDDGSDEKELVLHRWAEPDGSKLCAMSALSRMLGYENITDLPAPVDPGLNALVGLLSDRASDEARQLLVSRLKFLPNTGRIDLYALISEVYFPKMIESFGDFTSTVRNVSSSRNAEELSEAYEVISRRFLKPDGVGDIAVGCITIAAALKSNDPTDQDLLAVSATSQMLRYDDEHGWFELLQILDFILGLEDEPWIDREQPNLSDDPSRGAQENTRPSTSGESYAAEEIYDCGIKVRWFPALLEEFPDQLEEIAEKILSEVTALGTETSCLLRFPFGGEEVLIDAIWDLEETFLFADADLVAYQDTAGEIEVDGEKLTLLLPMAASEVGSIH